MTSTVDDENKVQGIVLLTDEVCKFLATAPGDARTRRPQRAVPLSGLRRHHPERSQANTEIMKERRQHN